MADLEKGNFWPEEKEFQTAQVAAMQICEDAKLVSPESSAKISESYVQYLTKIGEIHSDRSELSHQEYAQTLKQVSDDYLAEIKSIVGTTEGSQAKLVEDGKDSLRKLQKGGENATKNWTSEMQWFRDELRARTEMMKNRERERWAERVRTARIEWDRELLASNQEAPKKLTEWFQLNA